MTGKLTGKGVLLWLGGFFAVVIAVNAYFIAASVNTFSGEDEQKPYLQGIEYNRTLAERAEQAKLNWSATITAIRLASGDVRVIVTVADSQGVPQSHIRLSAEFRHPADENRDHTVSLRDVGDGRYEADIKGVAPGGWDVVVDSSTQNAPFQAERRLFVS